MAVDEYDLMTALESLGHINIRKGCQEMPQKIIDQIRSQAADYEALRRDLHAHPELGFDEHRTVEVICAALDHLSIPYQTGMGRTGIVGVIPGRATSSGRAIGLRADMDALPVGSAPNWTTRRREKAGCTLAGTTDTSPCFWPQRTIYKKRATTTALSI